MDSTELVAVGLVGALFALGAGIALFAARADARRRAVRGEHAGHAYAFERFENEHQTTLRLRFPAAIANDILVLRTNAWDRIAVCLGLARPLPTGDPAFDAAHDVHAGDAAAARAYVSVPAHRAALAALMRLDASRIEFSVRAQALDVTWTRSKRFRAAVGDDLRPVVELAAPLLAALPAAAPGRRRPRPRDGHTAAVPFLFLAIGAFAFSGIALLAGYIPMEPLEPRALLRLTGLPMAAALAAFLAASFAVLRNRTEGHRLWLAGALIALLGLPGAVHFGAAWANGAFDQRAPVTTRVAIVARDKRPRSGTFDYFIETAKPWYPPRADTEIAVPAAVYTASAPGRLLEVTVRPGWLGIPWQRYPGEVRVIAAD
ncbi:MAG: hypothetical protein AB7Q81_10165 [Gammaproteobacteria bacterium]